MRAFDTVAMLALRALLTIYERQQWSEWEFTKAAVSRLRGPV
jgi:hypothetical protein